MYDCLICMCPIIENLESFTDSHNLKNEFNDELNKLINNCSITCANPYCTARVCKECLEYLITYSAKESLIPKCPSNTCNSIFLRTNIKRLFNNLESSDILNKFDKTCFEFFLKEKELKVRSNIQEEELLKKLRAERMKFIEESFPNAIYLTARIAFKDKLKKLDKMKAKKTNELIANNHKRCMNLACNGLLDNDPSSNSYVCTICDSKFCKKCEQLIDNESSNIHIDPNNHVTSNIHVCNEELVSSVDFINNQVKCPGCKLPVFKNEGCDSITCSNCSTNFKYSTGEIGGHGSHNTKLVTDQNDTKKLSHVYQKVLNRDQLDSLVQYESTEPKKVKNEIILKPIKEYLLESSVLNSEPLSSENSELFQTFYTDLSKKLELLTKNKYDNIVYQRKLIELEKKFRKLLKNDST